MKVCPNCQTNYPDDANFCPQERCATAEGPSRLTVVPEAPGAQQDVPPPRFAPSSRIGGSRSGEIWQAHDNQTGEDVAYKVVAADVFPSPAGVERALRELKQLTRAANSHVARVVDFGKTADGRVFAVSELLSGVPLDQIVRQSGPLPLERAKRIAAQIGEALLEGQKVGVIHHDLAAKNVLVDENDQVKVINFAIPRPLNETAVGVPEYLSPEQAEGKLVDQRSNTYSLGAILMLMLTGEPPVSGDDARAVLENVLRGEVTPPSRRRPGLPADVDRVVMKALEKSSSRRPLTMRQFLTDVANLSATPPSDHGEGRVPMAQPNFAKTMMFTGGGSPEVRRLVAEAVAARSEANGSGPSVGFSAPGVLPPGATPPPVAVPPSSVRPTAAETATPPPVTAPPGGLSDSAGRRAHGAAVAATMVAMPAATGTVGVGPIPGAAGSRQPDAQVTPPPVAKTEAASPAGASAPSASAGKGGGGKGANFRETLWFKKGDVEQMVAEAKAKAVASGKPARTTTSPEAGTPSEQELPLVDEGKPLEDRYLDDGSLTVEDRKKFSLRSGGTATALPVVGKVPGERMSESEMLNEIGGGKRIMIIVIAVAVVAALVAVLIVGFKGKDVEKSAEALVPVPVPTKVEKPAEPPPPAPPATPPAPPAPREAAAPSAPIIKEPAPAPKPRAAAKKKTSSSGSKASSSRKKATSNSKKRN